MADDTIYALATPPGRSAVAVVRLSGPRSRFALQTLAGPLPPARQCSLRRLRDPASGEVIDSALILWFDGPASFTGDDAAELHLHGGRAVIDAALEALAHLGLRPAEPGEFTRRAFRNGKLDLTAVEGLADLIDAQTAAQRRQALRMLGGALAERVGRWREALLDAMSLLEADIDFSDEGDVSSSDLLQPAGVAIESVLNDLRMALAGASRGERLREGLVAVIAGPPNAGKSTLLNILARREVAIVSPIPGTTRDAIEVSLDLGGLPLTLIDTAGLRDTQDPVESEGIRRALGRAAAADLVLWLTPADSPEVAPVFAGSPAVLAIATKIDSVPLVGAGRLPVSALTGEGIDSLLERLMCEAADRVDDAAIVSRERHRRALESALASLARAREGLAPDRVELAAEDVRLAVRSLESLLGRVDVEHVLDRLFLSFCIGK